MKFARVEHNVVVEVVDGDPEGLYHPSITWFECSDDVDEGYSYINSEFEPPVINRDIE